MIKLLRLLLVLNLAVLGGVGTSDAKMSFDPNGTGKLRIPGLSQVGPRGPVAVTAAIATSSSRFDEGQSNTFNISVSGATAGQRLKLALTGTMGNDALWVNGLAADIAAGSLAGSTYDTTAGEFVLAAGSYTISFTRTAKADFAFYDGDDASFFPGRQKQGNVVISAGATNPFTGTITTTVASFWVNDSSVPGVPTLPALSGAAAPAAVALPAAFMPGVNIAGGEFGIGDYRYIYPDAAHMDYWAAEGFKAIRVPFLEQNLFDISGSPSNITFKKNTTTNSVDMDQLEAVVAYGASKGLHINVDMHNYGANRFGVIGTDPGAIQAFGVMWRMIAIRLKQYSNVSFGISNEPNIQTAVQWRDAAQVAVNHIRDVGAGQAIFVNGTAYSGAHSWVSSGNASAMLGLTDPSNNLVFEAHQYPDFDASGSHFADADLNTTSGATQLLPFTNWLLANNKRGFIGEFGLTGTAASLSKGDDYLATMTTNKNTGTGGYVGYSYWSTGAYWPDNYPYLAEPRPFATGTKKGQEALLQGYFAARITSASSASVKSGTALSYSLTSDQTVTWSLAGGPDQAQFSISGSTLTLPAKDSASPTDADANGSYIVVVRATNAKGVTTDQTFTATVTATVYPAWVPANSTAYYDFGSNNRAWSDGAVQASSTSSLAVTRASQGYDLAATTLFSANTARRTAAGLLDEATATNVVTNSRDQSASSYTPGSGVTRSVGSGSPDGSGVFQDIFEDATTTSNRSITGAVTTTPDGVQSFSSYFKPGARRYVGVAIFRGGDQIGMFIDTQTMTVTGTGADYSGTGISGKIFALANGVYRIILTGSISGGGAATPAIFSSANSTGRPSIEKGNSIAGVNGRAFSTWGWQLETGSVATSLIATTTAAATRAADAIAGTLPTGTGHVDLTYQDITTGTSSTVTVTASPGQYTFPNNPANSNLQLLRAYP